MSLDSGMSREDKEKLLNQKMENIRRKNEELRKRHQEIEADKKYADIFSSRVTMDEVKPYQMKIPRSRPERSDKPREMLDHPPPPRPADIMPSRQRLSENDGPPPDPSYRFLSDPDRDGLETGRDNKREQWGRGGRGRGKRGGRGGGSLWEGSEDRGMEITSDRGGRGSMRGDRGGSNFSGDIDGKLDIGHTEGEFGGRGDRGFNRGRGRGRSNGNSYHSDGERRYEHGRGGRGRFNERSRQENENFGPGNGGENSESGGGGEDGRRGKISFASRDIRYYPDDGEDQRIEKGRGRGRGKYAQRHSFDEYDNNDRQRERGRGRGRGNYEHRSRGRGRGYGQYHEYEKWKAEREVIDEERLTRGRNHEGAWRREWDNDKLDQGNVEETEPVYDPRYPRSKSEALKLGDFVITPDVEDGDSNQVQTGPPQGQQGDRRHNAGRGSRTNYKGRGHNLNPEINAQRHEEEIVAELDRDGVFDDHKIEGHGDSFTVSVATTNQSTAGKFVRVGSGRRGKPASYIEQNEQEFEESSGHGGDKQHERGWSRGNRTPRGRGRGRGQGYGSYTGKDKCVSKWEKSGVVDGQASAASDSPENLETLQKHTALSHSTSDTQCPTHHQTQALSDARDAANIITSDLPTDEWSWTRDTSGDDSLETSVLSEEGAPLADDNQDGEEVPVKSVMEIGQNDHFINNGSNDRLDETEQHVNAEAFAVEVKGFDDKNCDDFEQHVNAEACAEAVEDFDEKSCEDYEVENRPVDKDGCIDLPEDDISDNISRNGSVSPESGNIIEATNSCQQEVFAVDLKASTEDNVIAEDSFKVDSTISVNQGNHENITTLPKRQNSEERVNKAENITEINDKLNSGNGTSKELYIENSNEKECIDCQEKFITDEKEVVICDAEVPKEDGSNENKKLENCLTPASSPTATEQLVPNIEWK